MKYISITSARRNPEQNKKYPLVDQLKYYYELNQKSDLPLYFVFYRDRDILTINININTKLEPSGIYCYPINVIFENGKYKNLYASNEKYKDGKKEKENKFVFVLRRKTNQILWLNTYNEYQYKHDIDILKNSYPDISIEKIEEDVIKFINLDRDVLFADLIWEVTGTIATEIFKNSHGMTNVAHSWMLILSQKLGYKAVINGKLGIINNMQLTQGIIFSIDKKFFEIEALLDNEIDYTWINDKKYKKDHIYINKDLIVNNDLDLSESNIIKLPNKIIVKGDFFLNSAKINNLPNELYVYGDLVLSDTKITELPDNLVVNGDLILSRTNIDYIPNTIKVKGKILK